ncbi:MAG: SPOR domain-containing protein [bacterium]|nr:SPOR domain-containing protein [bacterium]MBK8129895.1 SPOR domain-containing protein [bacterium]
MFKWALLLLCLLAVASAQTVRKSPVDLLKEGRLLEAQRILEQSDAPERYYLLMDALREPNAIEACFLYREISARFPGTDCDEFAQERLLQAAQMGIDISALVVEATPESKPGEWPAESRYEVERPYTPPTDTQRVTSSPELSSTTLDYGTAAPVAPDSGVVAASFTPDKPLTESDAEPRPKVVPLDDPRRPHDVVGGQPEGWYIQVGAFSNHANADKIAARLRSDGFSVFFKPKDHLMQVRVGAYPTKEEARAIGDKIHDKYRVPAVLVTVP